MSNTNSEALFVSHRLLRLLVTLNWVFGAAILVLLVWTFIAAGWVARALGAGDSPEVLIGMRLIMLIGILAAPITNVFLTRLLWIVESVRTGDAFVAENAERLKLIAWAVFALQVGHLFVVGIANSLSTPARPIHVGGGLSVTPWLAVLLLFVLAGVFDHGTRMREELEGTV